MTKPASEFESLSGTMSPGHPVPEGVDTSHGVILYVEDVTVSFDGFKALNGLSLYIDEGELRCLIGPNGAGKSTLIDVITGKTRPDKGSVYFGQTLDLTKLSEFRIAQEGIGRKFQRPTIFPAHSVLENVELALNTGKRVRNTLFAQLSGEQRDAIHAALDAVGLLAERGRIASMLSHGQKQWLEIGMLLVQEPRLLLVDEPVAGMSQQETEKTSELLASLVPKHSVVVVEHDMDFVRRIARKVTVLHEGAVLAEGTMEEVQNDSRVIDVYLGA